MIYGIPEFRLPKAIVEQEIDTLTAMGVEIRTNFVVGRTRKLQDLLEKDGYRRRLHRHRRRPAASS